MNIYQLVENFSCILKGLKVNLKFWGMKSIWIYLSRYEDVMKLKKYKMWQIDAEFEY